MTNESCDIIEPYAERTRVIFNAIVDALRTRIYNGDNDETDMLLAGTRGLLVIFRTDEVSVDHIDDEPPYDYSEHDGVW